jgi:hypothetical protein
MVDWPRQARLILVAGAILTGAAATAQDIRYEDVDGIRYKVTRQVVPRQVPVTEMQSQQQTYYRQQVTNDTIQQQQLYAVPVTKYELVSTLHGRWNPFATPYWTHEYKPVTVWQQQMATVQIPTSRATMVPETRTVQVPVTTYKTAQEEVVTRVAMGSSQSPTAAQPLTAVAAGSSSPSQPSATLVARPPAPASGPPTVAGGIALQADPPRQATGWRPPAEGRY